MDCKLFSYFNGTQRNVIVHNTFKLTKNNTMIPESYMHYYVNNTKNQSIF